MNFLFGFGAGVQLSDADRTVSEQAQAYWANFARTGDPNGGGLPAWPQFTVNGREYLAFTDRGAAAKAGTRRAFCDIFMQSLQAADGR